MTKEDHFLWVEKYRPVTPDKYLGNTVLKHSIEKYIRKNQIPHLLLSGVPGTGKTTLAKLLVKNINCEFIYINASDENGIDVVRDKIKNFISARSFKPLKIVILDEADYLSKEGAQPALRGLIETYSKNSRFIFTCNYPEKLIGPLIDRFIHYRIEPPSKKEVATYLAEILDNEHVNYDPSDIVSVVKSCYPSVRSCVKVLQENSDQGQFNIPEDGLFNLSYMHDVLELLKTPNKNTWLTIRQILIDNDNTDYVHVFKYLYAKIDEYAKNSYDEVIFAISEAQKWHGTVPDKELNASEMFLKIIKSIQK